MSSPLLSAMMCDGLGAFSDLDYKRALLVYDRILYLLPGNVVRFKDVTGRATSLLYPLSIGEREEFVVHDYRIPDEVRELAMEAARTDAATASFRTAAGDASALECRYAWRVVNCDGDLGGGKSIGLEPGQELWAQAILLNKFLLAADAANCVPIAGRAYVDRLMGAKYEIAKAGLESIARETGAIVNAAEDSRQYAVARAVVADLIPDHELERRSFEEIVAFKQENTELFERFSLALRQMSQRVSAMPSTRDFDRQLEKVLSTDVWKARKDLEDQMHKRWTDLFHGAVKDGVRGAAAHDGVKAAVSSLAIGVTPAIALGTLSLASAAAGLLAATPWLVQSLLEWKAKSTEAQKNGLYYLHHFRRTK
jgi:hypothetical protein